MNSTTGRQRRSTGTFVQFLPLWVDSSLLCAVPTSLGGFLSILLLALFAQRRIPGYPVFPGWAEGPWGRDPFDALGLCCGTPFLSLSGIRLHSLLLSPNSKPTSSLLHTDLSFSFVSFYQPITSNASICCACVRV